MEMCQDVFLYKQKTAYEMRISDWSSDVCSSDLRGSLPKTAGEVRIAALEAPVTVRRKSAGMVRIQAANEHDLRSEERRVGKECVSTCSSRGSTYHLKKHITSNQTNTHKQRHRTHNHRHTNVDKQNTDFHS